MRERYLRSCFVEKRAMNLFKKMFTNAYLCGTIILVHINGCI